MNIAIDVLLLLENGIVSGNKEQKSDANQPDRPSKRLEEASNMLAGIGSYLTENSHLNPYYSQIMGKSNKEDTKNNKNLGSLNILLTFAEINSKKQTVIENPKDLRLRARLGK